MASSLMTLSSSYMAVVIIAAIVSLLVCLLTLILVHLLSRRMKKLHWDNQNKKLQKTGFSYDEYEEVPSLWDSEDQGGITGFFRRYI